MSSIQYQEYQVRKIVNVHKHVDGPWFWGKFTAHPYVGCRSGCNFCYLRGSRYLGRRLPETFDSLIQIKINSVERLRQELPKLKREIISVGDWQQPAEDRYRLSRGMLEVVLDYQFPLFIVERSPLLVRDLDLLMVINRESWVGVLYSISSLDGKLKDVFEPCSPGVKRRLLAMRTLADAGIYVGVSMMPVLPFVGDDYSRIEELIIAARDNGASCILAGGLTMDGSQAEWTFDAYRRLDPLLEDDLRRMYGWQSGGKPNYSPPRSYNARLGMRVRELCAKHGIADRMPRYIPTGKLSANKRIAELLFLKTYDLELEMAGGYQVWAYRKAAWTVDEMDEDIQQVYRLRGPAGLQEMPGIGRGISGQIAQWLDGIPAAGSGDNSLT